MHSIAFASPDLKTTLARVQERLTESCVAFATAPCVRQRVGAHKASLMLTALHTENGLYAFRAVLHQSVVECLSDPAFDSSPYWGLIDAIGFWDGAHPGRWRYMGEEQRQRWIAWSLAGAAIAKAMGATS